jgi:hypothetical protein
MTPIERGDLADRLVPIAAGLACIVHGDGDQRDIAHVLAQLDQVERDALIVVLAGLIDPDATIADTFGYLTWDEHGMPAPPLEKRRPSRAATPPKTLRDIAILPKLPSDLLEFFIEEKQVEARIKYHQLGQRQEDIARELGVHERTVQRWVNAPLEVAA